MGGASCAHPVRLPQASTAIYNPLLWKKQITSMNGINYAVDQPVDFRVLLTLLVHLVDGVEHSSVVLSPK